MPEPLIVRAGGSRAVISLTAKLALVLSLIIVGLKAISSYLPGLQSQQHCQMKVKFHQILYQARTHSSE